MAKNYKVHESHQGIVKTKQLLRQKVWWPSIDIDVMSTIKTCHACQMTSVPPREPPVVMTKLPDGPWQRLAMDISGPIEHKYYLLAVTVFRSWKSSHPPPVKQLLVICENGFLSWDIPLKYAVTTRKIWSVPKWSISSKKTELNIRTPYHFFRAKMEKSNALIGR